MSDYPLGDEITFPFIFVADGADPPPELAAFKSAHPDWVSFPATFIPHEQPHQGTRYARDHVPPERAWQTPSSRRGSPPQPTRADLGAALRAFQQAKVEHPDPVMALRALRDTPEDFGDRSAPIVFRDGAGYRNSSPGNQLNALAWQDLGRPGQPVAPTGSNFEHRAVVPPDSGVQQAQELLLEDPPAIIRPPLESFPDDPTQSPGPGIRMERTAW